MGVIGNFLRKNMGVRCVLKSLKAFGDSDYHRLISSYYWNDRNDADYDTTLFVKHMGELNQERKLYFIEYGVDEEDFTGFFALVRQAIYKVIFAEFYGFEPLIYWGNQSLYTENKEINGSINGFEHFFKPISGITYDEATQSSYVCISRYCDCFALNPFWDSYYFDEKEYEKLATIYKKYFLLNDTVKNYIEENVGSLLRGKRTLGIHVRGGDYKENYNNHPVFSGFEQYVIACKEALKINDFEQMFLATDDSEAIALFKSEFGEQVIFYNDFDRAIGKEALHLKKIDRENDKYLKGLEILRDVYTLVDCDGLITGLSQVAFAARYIKISKNGKYVFDKTIDNNVNKNGRVFKNELVIKQSKDQREK